MAYIFTYQTKNLINGKTYIGVHKTKNLNDGYLGSGYMLKKSIKKYGIHNFKMIPLDFFENIDDAYEEEKWLVNERWILNKHNYNLIIGGHGGWEMLNKDGNNKPRLGATLSREIKDKISKSCIGLIKPGVSISNKYRDISGFNHSTETKQKISITLLNNDWNSHREKFGKNISQFSKDDIFIKEWKSISMASSELNINRSNIISVLQQKRKTAGGYIWKPTKIII